MKALGWYLLAIVIVAIDQITKFKMVEMLNYSEPVPVIEGFFNYTLLYNKGAAFSFLADAGGWQKWFFVGVASVFSVVAIIWIWRTQKGLILEPLAIALILGGAIGNLYDRVTLGYVVDFIQVYWRTSYFPAFNVADMAITCGAILLIVDAIRETMGKKPE
jgi:signal peptidase II